VSLQNLPSMPAAVEETVSTPWRRLNPKMIVVRPLHDAVNLIPVLLIYLVLGEGGGRRLIWSGAAIAVLVLYGLLHWLLTKYRITDEQVQLHTGLISRKHLAVRNDRIRTVETTAKFGHRLFGLEALRIGTGQQVKERHDELKLDAITKAEAERLRLALLRRKSAVQPQQETAIAREADGVELASLRRSWLRMAPLTLSGLTAVVAGVGILFRVLNEINVDDSGTGAYQWLFRQVSSASLVTDIVVALVAVLLIVVVGGLLGYIFQFWNYRLTREPDHTVRIKRGLFTARAISIEEAKLRGVLIRESPLLRLANGARTDVISTGMSKRNESAMLVPPAPRAEGEAISNEVLRTARPPTATALLRHPKTALRRRIVRSLAPVVIIVVGLLLASLAGGLPAWTWQLSLVLLPIAALLGWDRYRSLGHALTSHYLVTRSGSLPRDTAALQRTGIIGWTVRSSLFQRRAGLITLVATSAAGTGAYHVPDVATADGIALADEALPGLLTPFLQR
jgi:putative membrane protein